MTATSALNKLKSVVGKCKLEKLDKNNIKINNIINNN